jgi:hypothetical protein
MSDTNFTENQDVITAVMKLAPTLPHFNGTKEFLARHATPDLMQYICVLAQQRDGSKLEQNCRNQLAAHAEEVVEANQQKQKKNENQALEKAREIEKAPWVETQSEVDDMTVSAIKMQLEKYQSHVGLRAKYTR